jgi:hypothetical protein
MKKIGAIVLAGVLVSLVTSAANAHTPRIERREARQHYRIAEGWRSGDLTRAEARRLRAGHRHVHRLERRAERDGFVTRFERRRIERAQDRQSRAIYRLKHNAGRRC